MLTVYRASAEPEDAQLTVNNLTLLLGPALSSYLGVTFTNKRRRMETRIVETKLASAKSRIM